MAQDIFVPLPPLIRFLMVDNNAGNEVKDSTQVATQLQVDDIARLAKQCRVSLKCKPHDPPYTVFMNGVGVMPSGDLFAIKAKAKQGKTQAASILMAGVLGSEALGVRAAPGKQPKVLYFDTEQAKDNTVIVGHRVHNLLGWELESDHKEFWCYNLRTESLEHRKGVIEYQVATSRPTIIVIDGVADLLNNFNDIAESQELILWLMQLADKYNVAVGCVIHENKGKDDVGMKGHLGTLLLQKAADVFEVTNSSGLFKLNHETARNMPAGFIQWRIDHGMLVRYDKKPEQVSKEMRQEHLKLWEKVFVEAGGENGFNALKRAYMKECRVSEKTARNHITAAVNKGFLVKNEDGKYELLK